MGLKTVDTPPFVFVSVPDWYKTQEMCDKDISNDTFVLKYCIDRQRTQKIFDKTIDDFLPAFVPDWFVTSKMIKKFHNALFTDDDILFFYEDSSNVLFSSDEIGILRVDLNIINRDCVNFDEDDPETIIHLRHTPWSN